MAVAAGLPPGAGRGTYESATYTCSHCCQVVVINPLRTRAREYCARCDHIICDRCGALRAANGGECKTFQQTIDEIRKAAEHDQPVPQTLILP
jgi:hypothetical protein